MLELREIIETGRLVRVALARLVLYLFDSFQGKVNLTDGGQERSSQSPFRCPPIDFSHLRKPGEAQHDATSNGVIPPLSGRFMSAPFL